MQWDAVLFQFDSGVVCPVRAGVRLHGAISPVQTCAGHLQHLLLRHDGHLHHVHYAQGEEHRVRRRRPRDYRRHPRPAPALHITEEVQQHLPVLTQSLQRRLITRFNCSFNV